jgi:hypothetical protein
MQNYLNNFKLQQNDTFFKKLPGKINYSLI